MRKGGLAPLRSSEINDIILNVKRDKGIAWCDPTARPNKKGNKKMEKYDYEQAMREDIRQYLEENWEKGKRIEDADRDQLHDDMWVSDSVTGNGSGSYTFSSWKAEENVCHNLDLLGEACEEFCVDGDTLADKLSGEWADVTIRCMMLGRIEGEIFDEWNAEIEEAEQDKDEDGE